MKQIKLEDIDRQLPFSIPEKYFEDLPMQIQGHISQQSVPIFTVSWSWKRTLITSMAASVVGILVWLTYPVKQHSIGADALSQVSEGAVLSYMQENNLVENELSDSFLWTVSPNDSTVINRLDISDKDIMNQLETENIDEEVI